MNEVKRWYVSPRTIAIFQRADPNSEIPPDFSGLVLASDYDAMAQRYDELFNAYTSVCADGAHTANERDALRAEVERLRQDKDRLDAIEGNCWDVRYSSCQNGDSGDSSIGLEIVGHFMDAPCERVVGENYNENLRAAIDQAMTADAYPPARPDYGEEDAIGAAMEARQ